MKNRKNILSLVLILFIGLIAFQLINSYFNIKKTILQEKILNQSNRVQDAFKNYQVVQCSFDFLQPEYAIVTFQKYIYPERNINDSLMRIDLYNLNRSNIFSSFWSIERIAGINVNNLSFSDLVRMVKEDCSQFKASFGELNDDEANWTYSEYQPKPEISPDQEKEALIWHKVQTYRSALHSRTPEQLQQIKDVYGDWTRLDDDKFAEWGDQLKSDVEAGLFSLEE